MTNDGIDVRELFGAEVDGVSGGYGPALAIAVAVYVGYLLYKEYEAATER